MPKLYLKLEVDYDDDPEIVMLNRFGAQARACRDLLVAAWRYCKRGTTDGHVPMEQIGKLAYPDTLKNALRDADRLVQVGLAERTETGYYFPGYLKHNPSRAQLEAIAAKKAEAGKLGGKASGVARQGEAEAKQSASVRRSQTSDLRQQTSDDTSEKPLGGERPETLRAVPDSTPPKEPSCIKHPDGNPNNEKCGGCAKIRERTEAVAARDAEKARKELEDALRNCPRCEGTGKVLTADKIATGRRCWPHVSPADFESSVSGVGQP